MNLVFSDDSTASVRKYNSSKAAIRKKVDMIAAPHSLSSVQGNRDLRKDLMLRLRLSALGGKGHLVEPLNPFLGDQ